MRHGQAGRGAFPPSEPVDVVSLATQKPAARHCPATRWSIDDLVAARRHQPAAPAMSRSTLWQILENVDRKPHRSVYWLHSHDPDFDPKARSICDLYVNAPRLYHEGFSSSASTKRPACRCSSGSTTPNWSMQASPRNGSMNTSVMVSGHSWPLVWSRRARCSGTVA